MNDWRKCTNDGKNCGLVDGIWYILEVQGEKRPFLGKWDEENARFVGSGLVGRDLDEAIEVKSGKILYFTECPKRVVMSGVDLSMSYSETCWDWFRPICDLTIRCRRDI